MAITATSSVSPLPQLTALQAKQINDDSTQPAAAPKPVSLPGYASPIYKFDPLAKISIEVIRDTTTGSVINQIPPEQVVQKYRLGQLTAATNTLSAQTNALTSPNEAAANAAAKSNGGNKAGAVGGGSAAVGATVSIKV